MPIKDIAVDTVFIGSCTNGRIDDLRQAAAIMKGHRKAENIHRVLVVPASSRVRLQAEKEGLDKVFKDFGAEWRNAGCSMCLGMNPDKLVPNERSISTSNRNFEAAKARLAHASGVAGRSRRHRHPRHNLVSRRSLSQYT